MALNLGEPDRGCLLLADISGYTEYMAGTELMHAQDVVADLLETIVRTVEPTFIVSKLEGDAAFAHADQESINPSMVMDTVESVYFAFQKRLRDIVHSTTCECDACIRIPSLDLKFFIHDGEYVIRRIARTEELAGPDVILVHRLMSGTAGVAIGNSAYAVYTGATLDAMALDPAILGFLPHTETLEGIGEVKVYVQDLASRWTFEKERNRDYITTPQAVYENSQVTTAAPGLVWSYLTDPTKRILWQKHVTGVNPQSDGRQGIGSVNHCMHGDDVTIEHVADWRPFDYITTRYDGQWPTTARRLGFTYQIDALESGARLTTRIQSPGDEVWDLVGSDLSAITTSNSDYLRQLLDEASAG